MLDRDPSTKEKGPRAVTLAIPQANSVMETPIVHHSPHYHIGAGAATHHQKRVNRNQRVRTRNSPEKSGASCSRGSFPWTARCDSSTSTTMIGSDRLSAHDAVRTRAAIAMARAAIKTESWRV